MEVDVITRNNSETVSEEKRKMGDKVFALNRKIGYEYFVEESLQCGIELKGTEVKSIRANKVSIGDAWCNIVNGELFVNGMHIAKYENGNLFNHEEVRVRKLLARKKEITDMEKKIAQQGYTLVPKRIYACKGKVKIEVCLCKGKHNYDKREALKSKEVKRKIERTLREYN